MSSLAILSHSLMLRKCSVFALAFHCKRAGNIKAGGRGEGANERENFGVSLKMMIFTHIKKFSQVIGRLKLFYFI